MISKTQKCEQAKERTWTAGEGRRGKELMDVYRVTGDSPKWQHSAYDYIRIDAFCVGQSIPVEFEFNGDEEESKIEAVILIEDHKPVAGCRIAYRGTPEEGFAQIQRVATVREKQKQGYGKVLIAETEKWILEKGYKHVLITSQDRSVGFYNAVGYKTLPEEDLFRYFPEEQEHRDRKKKEQEELAKKGEKEKKGPLSFSILLVEKYLA